MDNFLEILLAIIGLMVLYKKIKAGGHKKLTLVKRTILLQSGCLPPTNFGYQKLDQTFFMENVATTQFRFKFLLQGTQYIIIPLVLLSCDNEI